MNSSQVLVRSTINDEASNRFALAYEKVKSSVDEEKDLKAVADRMACGDE